VERENIVKHVKTKKEKVIKCIGDVWKKIKLGVASIGLVLLNAMLWFVIYLTN